MKAEKPEPADSRDIRTGSRHRKELSRLINRMSMEEIRSLTRNFFGKTPAAKNKAELVNASAELFAFSREEDFNRWFFSLPEISRGILRRIVFEEYLPLSAVEGEYGISLLRENKRKHSWVESFEINEEYRLGFVYLFSLHNQIILCLSSFLRTVLQTWLVPPPELTLGGCRLALAEPGQGWDNSLGIAESFPLFCDALKAVTEKMKEPDREKAVRGFKKRDIQELRSSSAFPPFPAEFAPDSADLTARFVLCMKGFKPARPADGQDGVRDMAADFFNETSRFTSRWNTPDRNFLEFNLCLDHLSRNPGYYLDNTDKMPPSRKVFQEILLEIARDGGVFDADKLAGYILGRGKPFFFCDETVERSLRIRADSLTVKGVTYEDKYYEDYHPVGPLRFELLVKPLFKAYCYLFAA
ncbi:MAG: hypothetical protein LBT95_07910, partial [Treponema sp.]|nr:hypothetical protein [Treponema sp.]